MKAAVTTLIDIETESEEVTVARETEETANEVTDIQKTLHTTEVLTATAPAETMARHQVEGITAVQVEETMVHQPEEETSVQVVEITVLVAHTAKTHTLRREIEILGMIAEEAGQIGLMDREGEEGLGVEGMEVETENEVCHPRDRWVRLQI